MEQIQKIALLIDAENIGANQITKILDKVAEYGIATYKRVYGDWNSMSGWKDKINAYSLTPIQQSPIAKGKNASDIALVIEAMDILYANTVDAFCIVSSDSDFTRLMQRIRESGKKVLGIGRRTSVPSVINACHEFIYLDDDAEEADVKKKNDLVTESKTIPKLAEAKAENPKIPEEDAKKTGLLDTEKIIALKSIIDQLLDNSGSALVSEIGNQMKRRFPDFSYENYNCINLSGLLKAAMTQKELSGYKLTGTNMTKHVVRKSE